MKRTSTALLRTVLLRTGLVGAGLSLVALAGPASAATWSHRDDGGQRDSAHGAGHGSSRSFPSPIALPDGFAPEGIAAGRGTTAYLGSREDGSILRLDVRTGRTSQVTAGPGTPSLGLKADRRGRLFVAGGSGGDARVVDSRSGEVLASYTLTTSGSTFVNDVVLTKDAAWFTDSSQAQLYRVPLGRKGSLPAQGQVETVPLGGAWVQPDGLGANGITQTPDRRALLVVNTTTGLLYRVDPATGEAAQVDVGGVSLERGDGMLLEGRRLYVVQNTMNKVAVIRLDRTGSAGTLTGYLRSSDFDVPTTVARVAGRLYLPNARFTTPDATQFSVVRLCAR